MRIAVDGSSIGKDPSGARTRFVQLLRAYTRLDERHDVVAFVTRRSEVAAAFAGAAVDCVTIDEPPPPWRRWLRGAGFWDRKLADVRADLFQAETLPVPRVTECKTTLTLHDLRDLDHSRAFSRRVFARHLLARQLTRVSRVICVSEHTAKQVRERLHVPAARVAVVENAPDANLARVTDAGALARLRARWSLPSRFVLALGHLEARKGLDRLVKAMGELHLRDGFHQVGLVLAGHDREAIGPRLETAANAFGVRLVKTGGVTDEERSGLLTLASVLAIPSRVEGFGIVPLEAMKLACPVVYAKESALPETIGDAGEPVNAGDAHAFADALARVMSDAELRARLIERGMQRVARASWQESARVLHRVWSEVVTGSGGAH